MLKKYILYLLAVLILAFTLIGCNRAAQTQETNVPEPVVPETALKKPELTIVAFSDIQRQGANGKRCYEIYPHTDGHGKLFYYDFDTLQINWLTDQSEPTDDETNPGWVSDILGGTIPIATEENLYLVKLGTLPVEEFMGYDKYIVKMGLDGSKKETITIDDRYCAFDTGAIACDGEDLYFILDQFDENEDMVGHKICKTDFSTGKIECLMDFGDDFKYFIMGTYTEGLVLQKVDFSSWTNSLYLFNAGDNTIKDTGLSWENGSLTTAYADEGAFCLEPDSQKLTFFDYASGETKEIDVDLNPNDVEGNAYLWDGVHDGYLPYSITSDNETFTSDYYVLNLKDFSVQDYYLQRFTIFADAGDSYMVRTGEHDMQTVKVSANGNEYPTTEIVYEYALISKADYWAGIENFRPFTDNIH